MTWAVIFARVRKMISEAGKYQLLVTDDGKGNVTITAAEKEEKNG